MKVYSLLVGLFIVVAVPAVAQDHAGHGGMGSTFGRVHFDISCSAESRAAFDGAVAMLHSFFYPETDKAFRAIAGKDPGCAMAHWGVAISQRPNPLTAPFSQDVLKAGWEAIQRARAASTATPRERAWIEALASFFKDHDTVSQKVRSARYEKEMAALHASYPADSEASVFYALALLEAVDLTDKSYARQLKAAALLERLQKAQPEHPGIPHYLIHAYDYAPIAAKGLPAARRYASLAPSAPHALHMPSHTFSTLGMWNDAISANLAADAANRAYAATTNPASAATPAAIVGRYHALDFLENAYLQLGQDLSAREILDERNSLRTFPAAASITAHTAFAAIPVRHALDRANWSEASALVPMESPFKQAEAVSWFGRGIGAARTGQVARATEDLREIVSRQKALTAAGDPYWAEQVGIQAAAVEAWIAFAGRDLDKAVALMRDAAEREDRSEKHIAMENRLSPMRELFGELLLQAQRPRDALREFQRSLRAVPNRRRSLAGAVVAAEATGNTRLAESYRKQLPQASSSLSRVAPEAAGMNGGSLKAATDLLRQLTAERKIAGAVAAVARRGKLAYMESVGVQDVASGVPMTDRSLFRIYSMTKAVTAVAAMMLLEEGKFSLDDPVSRYLPEFKSVRVLAGTDGSTRPPAREITVRDLLLHTSGLNHRTSQEYQRAQVRSRSLTLQQFIANVVRVPLMEDPGTRYRYSESSTIVGRLVEIWSGVSFDVFLRDRVFKPLGMIDTGFWATPDQRSRLTTVYAPAGEAGGIRPVEIEAVPFTERPTLIEGAVGLLSTVPDFLRFSQMLLNKGELDGTRLLAAKSVDLIVSNGLPDAILKARGGSMGWGLGNVNIVLDPSGVNYPAARGEYGWDGTAGTIFWVDPGKQMITILMTQSSPANPDRIRQRFKTLVEQAVQP